MCECEVHENNSETFTWMWTRESVNEASSAEWVNTACRGIEHSLDHGLVSHSKGLKTISNTIEFNSIMHVCLKS